MGWVWGLGCGGGRRGVGGSMGVQGLEECGTGWKRCAGNTGVQFEAHLVLRDDGQPGNGARCVLCCAVPCWAALCCAVLCCARCDQLCRAVLCALQASPYTAGNATISFEHPCDYFTTGKVKASTLSLSVLVVIEML